jgi:hypothetical protein
VRDVDADVALRYAQLMGRARRGGSRPSMADTLIAATASYEGTDWSYDGALQFSRFRWDYGEAIGAPGPQVVVRGPSGLMAAVVGNPGFVFDNLEETWQTTHRVSRDLGAHRLSAGVDVIASDFALLGGGNPDGNFTVDLTAGQRASLSSRGLALTPMSLAWLRSSRIERGGSRKYHYGENYRHSRTCDGPPCEEGAAASRLSVSTS